MRLGVERFWGRTFWAKCFSDPANQQRHGTDTTKRISSIVETDSSLGAPKSGLVAPDQPIDKMRGTEGTRFWSTTNLAPVAAKKGPFFGVRIWVRHRHIVLTTLFLVPETEYILEIFEPGSFDDVWMVFSSSSPFMPMQVGEILNPGVWPHNPL